MGEVKNYPPYLDHAKPYKAKTNVDRIREMSDEELRNWLFQRDCKNIAAFFATWRCGCDGCSTVIGLASAASKGGIVHERSNSKIFSKM